MASIASTPATATPEKANGQTYRGPFAIMTILFFLWGFITVLNDILIPRLQDAFSLTNYQIMFVQTAFFGAYFIGGLLYFVLLTLYPEPDGVYGPHGRRFVRGGGRAARGVGAPAIQPKG